MWDILFILITLACFGSAVLYAHACVRLQGERNHG
jgi:hypothetical protein